MMTGALKSPKTTITFDYNRIPTSEPDTPPKPSNGSSKIMANLDRLKRC